MGLEKDLKGFKSLISTFHSEMKSNSITDLIVWVDCMITKQIIEREERKRIKPIK